MSEDPRLGHGSASHHSSDPRRDHMSSATQNLPEQDRPNLKRSRDEYERVDSDHMSDLTSVRRGQTASQDPINVVRRQEARHPFIPGIEVQRWHDQIRRNFPFARSPDSDPTGFGTLQSLTAHSSTSSTSPCALRSGQTSSAQRRARDLQRTAPPARLPHYHTRTPSGPTLPQGHFHGTRDPRLESGGTPDANGTALEFNGLKYVPTGARKQYSASDATLLSTVSSETKNLPHIFIPGTFLPPQQSTVPHLYGFLRQYVRGNSKVHLDSSGYYVTFENDQHGRDDLEACHRAKHRSQLFGQYTLEMMPFPHGQATGVDPQPGTNASPTEMRDVQLSSEIPVQPPGRIDADAGVSESVGMQENAAKANDENDWFTDPAAEASPQSRLPNTLHTSSPAANTNSSGQKPSPFRVPSRDKDDSGSSISSWTDFSASKPMKCHICKAAAVTESEALAQCSTCPRRYHRRCHALPQIPLELSSDHVWQCKRCVKKHVAPKSHRKTSPLAINSFIPSLAQAMDTESQPKGDRSARIDFEPTEHVDGSRLTAAAIAFVPPYDDSAVGIDPVDDGPRPNTGDRVERSVEDAPFSAEQPTEEADDLVKKSFNDSPSQLRKNDTLEMIRTTTDKPDSRGASAPDRKHHKWSGVAADRDIVMAGKSAQFSEQSSFERAYAEHERLAAPPEASTTPAVTCEARRSLDKTSDIPEAHDSAFEGVEDGHENKVTETGAAACQPEGSGALKSGLQNTASGPSTKRSKLQRVKCDKCNRNIAYNPSGKRLCTHCKREPAKSVRINDDATGAGSSKEKPDQPLREVSHKDQSLSPVNQVQGLLIRKPKVFLSKKPLSRSIGVRHVAAETPRGQLNHMSSQVEEPPQSKGHDSDLDFWKPRQNSSGEGQHVPSTTERPLSTADNETEDVVTATPSLDSITHRGNMDEPIAHEEENKKRQSFRSAARSSSDLGDSNARPVGTYKTLIGMALLSQKGVPMMSKEIVQWVADNIPGYVRDKNGNWENGLKATVTMHQEGNPSKNKPLWKPQDKTVPPFYWTLLPGVEKHLMRWDPERKQAVPAVRESPFSTRHEVAIGTADVDSPSKPEDAMSLVSTNYGRERERPFKKRKTAHETAPAIVGQPSCIQRPKSRPTRADQAPVSVTRGLSVESMPLSGRRPLVSKRPNTPSAPTPVATTISGDNSMALDQPILDRGLSTAKRPVPHTTTVTTAPCTSLQRDEHDSIAQSIKDEAETLDFTAMSLFEEWPEYDPGNAFDRAAKLHEIKQRPNRKQRMRQGQDPWSAWTPNRLSNSETSGQTSASFARQYRSPRKQIIGIDPDNFDASDVTPCETIEELFGVPPDPIAIMSEGQIAFRDGTRNEDGSLPRAREIFKTGYA